MERTDFELLVEDLADIKMVWKSCQRSQHNSQRALIHIAVWFVQVVTFKSAPFLVALGVKVPSHTFIRCRLYHCLIPSSFANLSATSFMIPSKSPSILSVTLCARLLKNEPMEEEVEEGDELPEVVVGMRL